MFIVFEGADAVGKNEMSTRFRDWLIANGSSAVRISFPDYESVTGKAILRHLKGKIQVRKAADDKHAIGYWDQAKEDDALMFQSLMLADKCAKAKFIFEYLGKGINVVCDRYWQSAYAYGGSDGLDDQWLLDIHDLLPKADVNFLLDLPPEIAAERRPQFRDRYETDREKQKFVRHRYLDLWLSTSASGPLGWPVIDASKSRDEVFDTLKARYNAYVAATDIGSVLSSLKL